VAISKKMQKKRKKILLILSGVLFFFFLFILTLILVGYRQQQNLVFPDKLAKGFKRVKDLRIGDLIYVKKDDGMVKEKITSIDKYFGEQKAYNLKIDGLPTFFANDFAVHNKRPERDPVCVISVAPSFDQAETETWNISNHGNDFKNLFQTSGSGWGPFQLDAGNKICLWGAKINGCQYPPNRVLPVGNICRGCDKACGASCNCSNCIPQCEMTCGSGGIDTPGHVSSNSMIRFRAAFTFCDGDGCGAAIRVKAPTGYIIKSFTANARSHNFDIVNPKLSGHLYFSRGMSFDLDTSMKPYGIFYEVSTRYGDTEEYGKKLTIDMQKGTKYFFIYLKVTSRDDVGTDLRDSWVELSSLNLELVKTTEVTSTTVEIINNSLIWYDGSEVSRWPFLANGQIRFRNPGGSWSDWIDYSTYPDTPLTRRKYSYLWTFDPANPSVTAQVMFNTWGTTDICSVAIPYLPQTGTITGNVYRNDSGTCAGSASPPSGWVVECGNQTYGYFEAETQADGTTFKCKAADGSYDFPQGATYIIRFKSRPAGWNEVSGCGQDTISLSSSSSTVGPLYLWQEVNPWFQTWEGDVHSNGTVSSGIPSSATNPYFSLHDSDESPGVVSYHGGSANFGEGTVSDEGWLAKDSFSKRSFNYFYQLVGSPDPDTFPINGKLPNENGVYYYDASLTLGKETVPDGRKLVILVDGDVTLTDDINVVPGGSLVLICSGNIDVAGSIEQLEGIYIADGTFSTGDADNQLTAEGVFIAQEFVLQRGSPADPLNNTTPYEVFYYRPDLVINSNPEIWTANYSWQEIPP
jgi:hypothetical protein